MGKGVKIPSVGVPIYHGFMGSGVKIPWEGSDIPWIGGQNTMGSGLDIS